MLLMNIQWNVIGVLIGYKNSLAQGGFKRNISHPGFHSNVVDLHIT